MRTHNVNVGVRINHWSVDLSVLGCLLPAACLIVTGYVSSNEAFAVFLITAGIGFTGISYAGWGVNPLDLAPQYAG